VLLENKSAIVYGAGGPIGGAVARAFAREGARVFLAGRTLSRLDEVAREIADAGGVSETGEVDTMDEQAVDEHADDVARQTGGIDVSFNAIGHGDVHGTPLIEMPFDDFFRPVLTALRSQFLTTRAAARHMVERGSGVILAITATTSRMSIPNVGGTGVAFDAIESLCRQLAVELGPRGIRVAWLLTTGIPEALHAEVQPDYGAGEQDREAHIRWMKAGAMLDGLTTLADVGNAVAFLASDLAAGMTATGVNLTYGQSPSR
jgi:3-oxoacyl-[acyl-carrier protein] reductase